MIIIKHTMLETKLENFEPKKLTYCRFRQLNSGQFKLDTFNNMSAVRTHAGFEKNFLSILEKHAPKKLPSLRDN